MANEKEVTIKVTLDSKGAVKGAARVDNAVKDIGGGSAKASKKVKGFGLQTVATGALAAAAFTKISQFAKEAAAEAFRLGTSAEETASKYRTVLGPNISRANQFLQQNTHIMGLSVTEGRQLVATTTAIAQGFGFVGSEAVDLGVDVVKLAADLQSFNDVPIEQTHRAITSALSGEREALKTLGIVIRETDVQERALANTGKNAADALTQQEKATATLELITQRAGKAVGDLNRTQDSTANKARRVQAEFRSLKENLSVQLLPVFDSGVDIAGSFVRTLNDLVEVPVVEQLKNQQDEFNRLFTIATNVNTSHSRRVQLIGEMQQLFPEYLKNIDAEKVTNEALRQILVQVNSEYEDQISAQQTLTPVQEAYAEAQEKAAAAEDQRNKVLPRLAQFYRENKESVEALVGELDVQSMSAEEAERSLRVLSLALAEGISAEEAWKRMQEATVPITNRSAVLNMVAKRSQEQLTQAMETARQELKLLGFSEERINELLKEYQLEAEKAAEQTNENTDAEEKNKKVKKALSQQIEENKERANELINKTGELTEAEKKEIVQLGKQNEKLQAQIDRRTQLLNIPTPEFIQPEKPEDQVLEAEVNTGEGFGTGGVSILPEAIKEMELTELIRQESTARQELREAETEQQVQLATKKLAALEKEIDMQLLIADVFQQSVMTRIETGEQLLNHILQTTKRAIKAKLAEAVATQVLKVLSSVPFPFNIAAAAAAGGAISLLFEKVVPEFQRGGVLSGPSHAQGGVVIMRDERPTAEAEGGEAIINKRSTTMFRDELSAINQAGGGRAFPGTRTVNAGKGFLNNPSLSVGGGGGGIDSGAIAAAVNKGIQMGMKQVELRLATNYVDEELGTFQKLKERVGN